METTKFLELRDNLKEAYLRTSTVSSGTILPNNFVSITRSIPIPTEEKSTSITTSMKICGKYGTIEPLNNITVNDEKVIQNLYSPSRSKIAVLRSPTEKKYVLEIWQNGVISHQIKIENYHQDICSNPYIVADTMIWSEDESRIMYMAEKSLKKYDLWKDPEEDEEFDLDSYLGKNKYRHNWGEGAAQFSDLEVFIFELESSKLFKVEGLDDKCRATYAKFVGDEGKSIAYCGIHGDYPSGVQYCMNKDSAIYLLENFKMTDLTSKKKKKEETPKEEIKEGEEKKEEETPKAIKISEESDAISLFPVPSPSGDLIAYLYTSQYNENHLFTTGLKFYRRSTKEHKVVVSDLEENPEDLAFYIYNGLGSDQYKWEDENTLLLPSSERAMTVLNRINFETLERKRYFFKFDFETDRVSVLDYSEEGMLVSYSNLYHSTRLAYFPHRSQLFEENVEKIEFNLEPEKEAESSSFADIKKGDQEIIEKKFQVRDLTGYMWNISGANTKEQPCLVFLHGGPHSFSSVPISNYWRILLKNGYSLLTLNFSGSWTYGKDINERLAGKIGEIDVEEIMEMIKNLRESGDIGEVIDFWGWSYSGYLGFALLQKHPHAFRRMLIGNPVVNLLYMYYSSDIPEWNFHEGLGLGEKFTYSRDLTEEEVLKMKKLSPGLLEFDKTSKTKVMLLIGDSDLRVTHRAGIYLFKKLKKLGIDIECKVYPGQNHSIRKVDCDFDHQLCSLNMFLSD